MKPQVTIHDSITGETITREMTAEEIALFVEPTVTDLAAAQVDE